MNHEDYMKLAIDVAKESEKEGGAAIGAVLVKDGKVIATGKSLVGKHSDPSAHAELACIRNACQQLQTSDLDDYALYSTLESCSMCISCAAWSNLSEVYFGAYRDDVVGNDYEVDGWSAEQRAVQMKLMSGKPMKITGGILREECKKLLVGYRDWMKTDVV